MVSVENNSILKKISAVIVMITALVFFSFNVFADTPVQPLQVVTYSDTTTNVRISGTAERLHYNVDSFQVVFMNPPNNYGTACTPILVSFRFYNSSDLPAYVGQAEFELTATTSTGSVNTIVYGYDQISTDLFVAESSYSTADVGRIGIGASNDFAYYTGFVIPPHTSLYFSCIVYVNASAYGQNNTGATEDVNQVTLSSLNLYTNQLSFSSDYPYHNQPVDFSDIISAIQDLNANVSTSTELQELIDAVKYTGNGPSVSITGAYTTGSTYNSDGIRYVLTNVVTPSFITTYDFETNSGNDTLYSVGNKRYVIYQIGRIITPVTYQYDTISIPEVVVSDNTHRAYVVDVTSNLFDAAYINGNRITLVSELKSDTSNYRFIIPQGNNYFVIKYYLDVPVDYNPSFTQLSNSSNPYIITSMAEYSGTSNFVSSYRNLINDIRNKLNDLYNAYSQVNGVDDSSDISNDVSDVSDSNHIIEESYYSANASAIEATGLSNYRFSNEQNNGIGKVADDFMLLWNALGSWNGVYIFSLTMALATFIMRHGGLFTVKKEVSDKGGESD